MDVIGIRLNNDISGWRVEKGARAQAISVWRVERERVLKQYPSGVRKSNMAISVWRVDAVQACQVDTRNHDDADNT
jgi:hypothetical protein